MHYVIGTRGSKLALTQTNYVKSCLEAAYPDDSFEIMIIKTIGDLVQNKPLEALDAKGIFTTEIEEKLLAGEIQLAVHSMKDMPEQVAEALCFSKAWKREDPRDVLILKSAKSIEELPENAVIGTGSKRRAFQLAKIRQDIKTIDIRGNVDTRIRKLMEPGLDAAGNPEPQMDGIVLAAAGLKRLGREAEITCYIEPKEMIPAPTQGILAIELRAGDTELLEKVNALSDEETERAAQVERLYLKGVGGNCHLPIGGYYDGNGTFYAVFGDESGACLKKTEVSCEGKTAEQIVEEAICNLK